MIGVTNSKFPRFVLSEIQSPELAFSGDPISVPRIASYTRRVLRHLTVALFCRDLVSSIVNLTRQLAVSRSVPFGAASCPMQHGTPHETEESAAGPARSDRPHRALEPCRPDECAPLYTFKQSLTTSQWADGGSHWRFAPFLKMVTLSTRYSNKTIRQ